MTVMTAIQFIQQVRAMYPTEDFSWNGEVLFVNGKNCCLLKNEISDEKCLGIGKLEALFMIVEAHINLMKDPDLQRALNSI